MSIRIGKDGRILHGSYNEEPPSQSTNSGGSISPGSNTGAPVSRNNYGDRMIIFALLLFFFIALGYSSSANTKQQTSTGSSSANTRQQSITGSSSSNNRQQPGTGSSNSNTRQQPTTGSSSANTKQQPVYGIISPQNTNSSVRLRSGPEIKANNIVRSLSHGDRVEILGYRTVGSDRWAHVNYNGQRGYVHSSLISNSQPNVSNNASAAVNRNNNNSQNDARPSNTQSAKRHLDEGEEAWRRQDWQAAYNAFNRAYQIDHSNETQTRRDNALNNIKAAETAAQQERARQQALENQRQLEMRQQQAQREAEEQRRREEENHRIAEQQRQQRERDIVRGIIGVGIHILNERKK